jgi:hypothetical protein
VERFARLRSRLRTLVAAIPSKPFDDGAGLPPSEPGFERAGRALLGVATLLLLLVGLWEIDAPFGAGHYAAATGVFTSAENFWRLGTLAPLPHHPVGVPSNAEFYCHHPFGVFWTAGLFSWLGHHAWVCRLPAVLMSTAMPALIYGAARALFGPLAAGLSALAFAVLPITLAYANFFALEVPTMFGMALAIWGFVRFAQGGRRRFAALFVVGLAYAMAADWPGFVFAGLVLGWLLVRGFLLGRFFAPLPLARFAAAWGAAVAAGFALALFHYFVLVKLDQLEELLRQGEFRSKGSEQPIAETLSQRRYWIALSFTPLAVWLGKLGAPVLALRALAERRDLEVLPLAVLATATFQYLVFKQGADIHFFWPHYFALYFAYALGALAVTLERAARWAATRFPRVSPRQAAFASFGCGVLALALIGRDGVRALEYARKSGGRFNEKGFLIHADFDKAAALSAAASAWPANATLGVHSSMKQSYWMDWVSERPVLAAPLPLAKRASRGSEYALDTRFTSGQNLRALARKLAIDAYGPFWFTSVRAEPRPLAGFAVTAREPGAFERFWVSSTHALYDVSPSEFWTWELRAHFGQEPNPVPAREPKTLEELRIAHNVAISKGDADAAARLRSRLFADTDRTVARRFEGGLELLALRLERGASEVMTLYFSAGSPLGEDRHFAVTSYVEAAPPLSLTPRDELARDVGMPFALPTSLWQNAFIYAAITEIVRRPGRERYVGAFADERGSEPASSGVALMTLD